MARFPASTVIPGWRLVRLIATGDFTEVYEVVNQKGERRALKIVEVDGPLDSVPQRRVAQGAEATAMVEDPNVIRFLDIGTYADRIWILQDFAEGGRDLRQVMNENAGGMALDRALPLFRQACKGMTAVHEAKIIHRDLKPENILVMPDGHVKVTGFASARLPGASVKTTTTQREGTARYSAPEFIWSTGKNQGKGTTPAMDVYSMGTMLYEAIYGKHPILPERAVLQTILELQRDRVAVPLVDVMPRGFPGKVSDMVHRAMAKVPAARCTMRELANELAAEHDVLLSWRRQAARNVPGVHRDPALALTEAFQVWSGTATRDKPANGPPVTIVVRGAEVDGVHDQGQAQRHDIESAHVPATLRPPDSGVRRKAGSGTEVMPQIPAPQPAGDRGRPAVLPPQPPVAPAPQGPAQVPAAPTTARGTEVMPSVPFAGGLSARGRMEPMAAAPASVPGPSYADRRSSGAPVESAARPSKASSSRPLLALLGVAVVAGAAATSWWLYGRSVEPPISTPHPAASLTAPASVLPSVVRPPSTTPATSASSAPSAPGKHPGGPPRTK
jgi:hypothetical protein